MSGAGHLQVQAAEPSLMLHQLSHPGPRLSLSGFPVAAGVSQLGSDKSPVQAQIERLSRGDGRQPPRLAAPVRSGVFDGDQTRQVRLIRQAEVVQRGRQPVGGAHQPVAPDIRLRVRTEHDQLTKGGRSPIAALPEPGDGGVADRLSEPIIACKQCDVSTG